VAYCCCHWNNLFSYRLSILVNVNNKDIVSIALSYASGVILVMLAESMIPEAFEEGGSKLGLAAMAGFVVAFVLGRLGEA
jgi:zinc transporter ZupT